MSPSRYVVSGYVSDVCRERRSDFFQGKVYDVTGNKMYQPGNSYNGR